MIERYQQYLDSSINTRSVFSNIYGKMLVHIRQIRFVNPERTLLNYLRHAPL